jgi:hypothetical protein
MQGYDKNRPEAKADDRAATRPLLFVENRLQSLHPTLQEMNAQHFNERNRSLASSSYV